MRILSVFTLICCLVACQPNPQSQQTHMKTYTTLSGKAPLLIGHRGAPGFGGENTMAGFRKAVEDLGADGFELDLLLTKDKKLVVGHDYELSRLIGQTQLTQLFPNKMTTDQVPAWYVTDFDLAELQQLKVVYPPGDMKKPLKAADLDKSYLMPSYDEVLDALIEWIKEKPDLKLYTEIKIDRKFVSEADIAIIAQEVEKSLQARGLHTKTDNIWLQSFDYGMMDALADRPALDALKKTQLEEWTAEALEKYSNAEAFKGYLQTQILDRKLQMFHSWKLPMRALKELHGVDFVQIAHEMGVEMHIYTFRDTRFYSDYAKYSEYGLKGFRSAQEEFQYFVDLGVDAVMTDYVISGREALGEN